MASKKTKSDILLKVNVASSRILEIGQNGIKTEQTGKGTITGRYRGTHWDTLEMQMNPDGTSSWQVKFIQMTDKGDMLVGTGSGTGEAPNSRGIAKSKGDGTIMTQSQRLADLNSKRWTCEVESNLRTDKAVVKVKFE
jgi:type V secretory pathway adhesin AidA